MRTEQEFEQEKKITELMAQTYNFTLIYKDSELKRAKCNECGKNLMAVYAGLPINERMIRHAEEHRR